jgi:hypothetical protein
MRRRLWLLAAAAGLSMPNTVCFVSEYPSDPMVRTEQVLIDSENLRQIHDGYSRIWMSDQPSHLTPYRIHGGVGPAPSAF